MEERTIINEQGEIYHINYQENVKSIPDGSTTLLELFLNQASRIENKKFLGTIINDKLNWMTYKEFRNIVEKISSFLNAITTPKDIIGIYSVNRWEWLASEYSIYMSGCINCPLYSTFGNQALKLVLDETEMKILISSADKAHSLYNNVLEGENPFLDTIILMDDDDTIEELYSKIGIKVFFISKIIKEQSIKIRKIFPKGEDLATICYTSGTSGFPKGVMLTHKNFISNVAAFFRGSTDEEMIKLLDDEVYLSYLPLAHVMERVCVSVVIAKGASIGFYRGNPKTIGEDYKIIRPTFIAAVPRVLNLFKEKIDTKIRSLNFMLRGIFNLAVKYKAWRQKSGVFSSWLLDALIFSKISKEFGGRLRGCLCGSAALKPSVLEFLQATLSMRIFQGYGQTEGTAANLLQPLDMYEFDNVGIPFPSNKIKLKRVSGYDNCSGEILIKGDCVTSGYFKRPEQTEELFDEEGWLKTGDIGRIHKGVFKIVGRRKEIFKTSFGEYIVPEKLENLFTGGIIEDVFITGSQYSDKLAAIVVCRDMSKGVEDVLRAINITGAKLFENSKITKFEIPSYVIVIRDSLETFNGGEFLTPTAKKRRAQIERHFSKEIEALLH